MAGPAAPSPGPGAARHARVAGRPWRGPIPSQAARLSHCPDTFVPQTARDPPGPPQASDSGDPPADVWWFLLRGAPKTTEHRDVWWFRSGPVPKSTKRPVRALRHDPHGPCGCQIPFSAARIAEMTGSAASRHRRPRPVPYDIGHPVRKEGVPMSATLPVVSITCAAAGMFLGHRFFLRLVRPALENRGR